LAKALISCVTFSNFCISAIVLRSEKFTCSFYLIFLFEIFTDLTDKATFAYSLDGKLWKPIGDTLQMCYDWPDNTKMCRLSQKFGYFGNYSYLCNVK